MSGVELEEDSCLNLPGRWYFDKAGMDNTPSRLSGIEADKELSYRQLAACFIQEMGQKLKVNQLCNNTAIVYMNRFYMYHSLLHFHRNAISIAAIFLAAKVEEQPRKLDHVVRVAHYIQNRNEPMIDPKSESYQNMCSELVMNENILLQTLGFDLAVDHPHTHIIKCCQLVRASKDLGQVSYMLATNILHLTTMCVQYRPTLVATLAIHVACKWSGWQIPRSKEGKDWWRYVDDKCTYQELEALTQEYLDIYNKAPQRLKLKLSTFSSVKASQVQMMMPPLPPLDSIGTTPSSTSTGGSAQAGGSSTSSASATVVSNSNPHSSSSSHHGLGTGNLLAVPQQPGRSRSRSPSPKRARVGKPGEGAFSHGAHPHGGVKPPIPPLPSTHSSSSSSVSQSKHPMGGHHGTKPPSAAVSSSSSSSKMPAVKPHHAHHSSQQPHPPSSSSSHHHHSSSSSSSSSSSHHHNRPSSATPHGSKPPPPGLSQRPTTHPLPSKPPTNYPPGQHQAPPGGGDGKGSVSYSSSRPSSSHPHRAQLQQAFPQQQPGSFPPSKERVPHQVPQNHHNMPPFNPSGSSKGSSSGSMNGGRPLPPPNTKPVTALPLPQFKVENPPPLHVTATQPSQTMAQLGSPSSSTNKAAPPPAPPVPTSSKAALPLPLTPSKPSAPPPVPLTPEPPAGSGTNLMIKQETENGSGGGGEKHKKKKKHKEKDKERHRDHHHHKEEKKHKKHKDKDKEKKKDKKSSKGFDDLLTPPSSGEQEQSLKIRLSLKKN